MFEIINSAKKIKNSHIVYIIQTKKDIKNIELLDIEANQQEKIEKILSGDSSQKVEFFL
jgi:hypothetical protein